MMPTNTADLHLLAQRGRLFKPEAPPPVFRDQPRATGIRPVEGGDLVRARLYPDRLFRVLSIEPCCRWCGGIVSLNEDGKLREVRARELARDAEHADGAGIEVRP